jgi:ribosome-binding protein aMBF1 (putative translation factor)
MNKHALMNKHAKIDVSSRGVQDERELFAAQIRAGRAVLGWSQTDLGERTGVTQRAIYRIEDGATRPRQLTRKSFRRRRR